MKKIMIVEDDTTINQVVCEFLSEKGFQVTSFIDGKKAFKAFQTQEFDLLVLDIMIPSMSGLELLQAVRKVSSVPVVMLTAMADEYTQLVSFNHQISDYVVKPFSPLILIKHIENIFRQLQGDDYIRIGDVELFLDEGKVLADKEEAILTKKEYDIMTFLAKRKGKIVTRERLMKEVWGYEELDSRVLDNHIKNIRKKIPNLKLKTIIGRGYQIEAK
ncbi:response regulator transcription factor [Streptococcus pseudoporcinus]|uniref:Transcriptional regulatory protein DltR n=1 Tax=Streptococcus pseudoporcinus TaxID=361101 RepID=A0A4U9XIZ7_9STRE|nr:response regulator transcription factor [Streptococcus pseudoporcinus]VTS12418.1 winged helix family two component transcriptional regulator [Streptococcus pseudoporcinus]VUC64945.1 winged helix family two component transcriptional regulator [Streptococcus pseudoporcinus]VUC95535.1 winged helix family two component transcriptional regulator [Streptococcus pseudoporcinus]VUC95930.1 winged helix family two component transcriptional regulator [Streptococcus pseudoporcinus]